MVSGTLAVWHHPHEIASVEVDGCNAAVRRLEQWEALWPRSPRARAGNVIQIRDLWIALDDIRGKRARNRLDVEHSGFRIECATLPIGTPDGPRQFHRPLDPTSPIP